MSRKKNKWVGKNKPAILYYILAGRWLFLATKKSEVELKIWAIALPIEEINDYKIN